ncbi:hypothetical protein A1Q2_03342 [Trichosporon asahii var. asahii CBS 8904]|uniref:Peroxisomal membrane protein PEX14 n=2 Tax=Trichosporon asahii var. asahii TaxID=189963 RepID=K1VZX0_TRIAC|nr:hypothetical protein A1Q1_00297 [Trichosporon asahii var. asahii CBS 2479]EJT52983.1 hypothetical protein A1Q1_00297 [Trichosporon asahii var. asahii CBS 2479]EKD02363.1 hypothetical protein A1Q2_03342 [Trichosporon asahii var. asahii CBS 8904]
MAQKVEFLQGKGLTDTEIQQALSEAANGTSNPSAAIQSPAPAAPPAYARPQPSYQQQPHYGFQAAVVAPEPPKRDWRDIFIMAVVSGGVMYGVTALARKYLVPHLKPPSSTAFQSTSAELSEQYDAAAAALDELRAETAALATAAQSERERVAAALEDVESAARAVKDAEARWRDDMREVRGEVESVRELVPRMIEKHAASQSAALTELQSELRSLKTLLVARQGGNTVSEAAASGAASPTPSATQTAANALLQPRGKASIPAWQLPNGGASAATSSAVSVGSVPSDAGSPTKETP